VTEIRLLKMMDESPPKRVQKNDKKHYLTEVTIHTMINEATKSEIFVTAKNNSYFLPQIF
jgi:hypothetical protein